MKPNLLNKIYLAIAVLLTVGIVYKLIKYRSWSREYYAVSVCAPETFPVYVREMYFTTANDEDVHADTEDVNYFKSRWGAANGFADANEANLPPEKLVLKYASYREKTFYNDTILLPKEKVNAAFEEILKSNDGVDIYYRGMQKPGLLFLIGIANNGNIVVWARGNKLEKEILRTKLVAKEPGEDDTYYGEQMTKDAYIKDRFALLQDSIKNLINSGFDSNANYIDSTTGY